MALFMDAEDKMSNDMLEKMHNTAISRNATFVLPDQICQFHNNQIETFSFDEKFEIFKMEAIGKFKKIVLCSNRSDLNYISIVLNKIK